MSLIKNVSGKPTGMAAGAGNMVDYGGSVFDVMVSPAVGVIDQVVEEARKEDVDPLQLLKAISPFKNYKEFVGLDLE
jgi:hypothetical protein